MPVLVDTSGILAIADAASNVHHAVIDYLAATREAFLLPVTVLPEADYLIASRLGVRVELAMRRSLAAGQFELENFSRADLPRCLELVAQYADSTIGLVDASIVAIAERLEITRILTLDYRHFRMFRPKHCGAFELVP